LFNRELKPSKQQNDNVILSTECNAYQSGSAFAMTKFKQAVPVFAPCEVSIFVEN